MFSRSTFTWLLSFSISSLALANSAHDWQKLKDHSSPYGNIAVFTSKAPLNGITGFRGHIELPFSLTKVYSILADHERRPQWMDRLESVKVLDRSKPYESIIYQVFDLPWPASSRDYVIHSKTTHQGRSVVIDLRSISHKSAPETDAHVRAQLHSSRYKLQPLSKTKTAVTVEIFTDLKGDLPQWIVDQTQQDWPIKTLEGLAKQCQQPIALKALPSHSRRF